MAIIRLALPLISNSIKVNTAIIQSTQHFLCFTDEAKYVANNTRNLILTYVLHQKKKKTQIKRYASFHFICCCLKLYTQFFEKNCLQIGKERRISSQLNEIFSSWFEFE